MLFTLKILLVANGYPPQASGGVETYTYDLAHSLAKAGHQVAVFCRAVDYSRPDYQVFDSLEDGIRVIRVVNDHKKSTSFYDTFLDEKIEALFKDYLAEIGPDLVHFNHLIALSARLPELADQAGVPCLVMLHDFWPLCQRVNLIDWQGNTCQGPQADGQNCSVCVVGGGGKVGLSSSLQRINGIIKSLTSATVRNRIRRAIPGGSAQPPLLSSSPAIFQDRRRLFLEAIQKAKMVLAPSNYVKENFIANGHGNAILVLPLGINLPVRQAPAIDPAEHSQAPVILGAIGSFIPHKGFDLLLRAFRSVPSENLRLNLYGRLDERSAYGSRLIDSAGRDGRITLMGEFAPQERGNIYRHINALVIPSLWESYSLVCREALASGIPVIAARLDPIMEVIFDQENGFLFDPGNEAQLAAILAQIANRPEILPGLNCPGPAAIPTQEEHLEALQAIYQQVIGSDRRP